jgi:hypothetical protein
VNICSNSSTGYHSTLQTIQQDLAKIVAQNRLLLIVFKDANKAVVDGCLDRLKDSLQTFQVCLPDTELDSTVADSGYL